MSFCYQKQITSALKLHCKFHFDITYDNVKELGDMELTHYKCMLPVLTLSGKYMILLQKRKTVYGPNSPIPIFLITEVSWVIIFFLLNHQKKKKYLGTNGCLNKLPRNIKTPEIL